MLQIDRGTFKGEALRQAVAVARYGEISHVIKTDNKTGLDLQLAKSPISLIIFNLLAYALSSLARCPTGVIDYIGMEGHRY